jgi:hypothetical protein
MLRRVADSASEPLIMLDIPRDIMQHEKGPLGDSGPSLKSLI